MKYVEVGGDVRGTSANTAYMGVVFQGTLDEALAQAKEQPDHGVPTLNGRAELLAFLRVKQVKHNKSPTFREFQRWVTEANRDKLIPPAKPAQPWDGLSPFSLEYAMARWPRNFDGSQNTSCADKPGGEQ